MNYDRMLGWRGATAVTAIVLGAIGAPAAAKTYAGTRSVAVPAPATWALLIIGFGATGVAMRRRRRSQPASV